MESAHSEATPRQVMTQSLQQPTTGHQSDDFKQFIGSFVDKHEGGPDKAPQYAEADAGPLPVVGNKTAMSQVMKAMKVPKRFQLQLLAGEIKRTTAMILVWDWHKTKRDDKWSLMLAGPTNTGKSFAAAYWLNLIAEKADASGIGKGNWQAWYRANDLSSLDRKEQRRLWECPFLVLDDLGSEYAADSGYYLSAVYSIICNRYDECLPTIITSNLTYTELTDRYNDQRIIRRLKDHGDWGRLDQGQQAEWEND